MDSRQAESELRHRASASTVWPILLWVLAGFFVLGGLSNLASGSDDVERDTAYLAGALVGTFGVSGALAWAAVAVQRRRTAAIAELERRRLAALPPPPPPVDAADH